MNEFCSADLLGYKFNVPCQVKEVLTIQYGEEKLWSMPTKTNYKTSNIHIPPPRKLTTPSI